MDFSIGESSSTIDACVYIYAGPDTLVIDLIDFIYAARVQKAVDSPIREPPRQIQDDVEVDTVAYHFSVLKSFSPNGITLSSLFSGIGGAEVALHRLGILLKTVVSVEISAEISDGNDCCFS
ncbi:hypothetical protein IFM89_007378 [Coptis chinensis]|uniref:SAM-dependent MTase DRM-type domain-containing protein n=1 Tax=Coptis chinensis TaxID=261450 RepID=A0A835IKP8_9MAGN|nr:hypothetical protein IFM89_007378 [Coptis chinensis]